jgi:prophage regulatory protein
VPAKSRKNTDSILPSELGFIRLPDILKLFPVGARSWDRGVKEGRYPAPVWLSPRVKAWRVSDIRELLESIANRESTDRRVK